MITSSPVLAIVFGLLGLCVAALGAVVWKEQRHPQRSPAWHRTAAKES
jgi:uncharacterized iron-regulated membrane protein